MGQYFKLVNLDKKEYIASDYVTEEDRKKMQDFAEKASKKLPFGTRLKFPDVASVFAPAKFWEWGANAEGLLPLFLTRQSNESGGGDIDPAEFPNAGRWAGDRIVLVGDYDKSKLYDKVETEGWKNIWCEIHNEFMKFYWGYIKDDKKAMKESLIKSLDKKRSGLGSVVKTHLRKTKAGVTQVRTHLRR